MSGQKRLILLIGLVGCFLWPPKAFCRYDVHVGDVNADGIVDLSDPVYLLNSLFSGEAELEAGRCCCWWGCFWGGPLGFTDPSRFVDHGDGVIWDLETGLMWQQVAPNARIPTWHDAIAYCQRLEIGGYTDWRLPNVRELTSLHDYGDRGALMPLLKRGFLCISSTRPVDSTLVEKAFAVDLLWGDVALVPLREDADSTMRWEVRAVRGGLGADGSLPGDVNSDGRVDISDPVWLLRFLFLGGPPPEGPVCLLATGAKISFTGEDDGDFQAGRPLRYVDNGDGSVRDLQTDLTWQKTPPDRTFESWEDVLAYSGEMWESTGHRWDVPFVGELMTIVDYGRHRPAASAVFDFHEDQYKFLTRSLTASSPLTDWILFRRYVNFEQGEVYGAWCLTPEECAGFTVRLVERPPRGSR